MFLDADTEPTDAGLLDRYFEPLPDPETVLLAGGIVDEPVAPDAPGPARYAHLRRTLSQERTLGGDERFAFAQTANLACRRAAFAAAGGFREDIRAAEDADLSYRLKAAGGRIERREHAAVIHHNRRTVRAFIAQAALHGAGAAWLDSHYPGAFPARRLPGLAWWGLRTSARGAARRLRTGDRDALIQGIYEPLWELAFELGRSRSVHERR
jgi:GT2 family glycosyltransferase